MEQLVNFIIRPPRADYSPKHDLLDPEFTLKGRPFRRKDLEVINIRGNVLQCSHYVPVNIPEGTTLPCVIYCHGNSGCRADASEAAIILLPSHITVFALDFSGSGLSEGEHVTLGWNEKDDLKAVVDYLRAEGNVSCIGLWGRSMGAVTSLLYAAEDPSIAGIVLDSPFSNLVDLMMELVDTYKIRLPKFTVKIAIQMMRRTILRKAKFDIMELNAIQVAKSCFVPVLLGHANDDDFILRHHSDRIYEAYMGDKNIIKFDGDHNSPRPQFYFDSITIFFHNVLNPPKVAFEDTYFQTVHNYFDKDYWDATNDMGHETRLRPSEDSTEGAISQLRSVRPMSRTEIPDDITSDEYQLKVELQGKGTEDDLGSSSRSITFDFSKNTDPLVPTTDEQYLEYTFEKFRDVPYDLDDEERQMFMEAVIESLKVLEIRHPHEKDKPSDASPPSLNSCEKDERGTSTGETVNNDRTSVEPDNLRGEGETHVGPTCDPSSSQSTIRNDGGGSDASTSMQRSSASDKLPQNDDRTAGTRATLRVQKNPANHVIDGLSHRWGLNFFRSS